eukprot:NODE_7091_length_332_cov_70.477032_g6355_i0.p2 GENE.NODE_7091_length_332_cov_70.477032_g6355_i0~~NODE_7091_length_332_cov_70.477032_g6355_i0.p2  ORF type:complete len:53 (+),score=5.18 NODE_7091_length_332_cov_70.477032_g6355_i0:72-230(+)
MYDLGSEVDVFTRLVQRLALTECVAGLSGCHFWRDLPGEPTVTPGNLWATCM